MSSQDATDNLNRFISAIRAGFAPGRLIPAIYATLPVTSNTTASASASLAMAAPGFPSNSQSLRSYHPTTQSSFPPSHPKPPPPLASDAMNPIGTPFANSPLPPYFRIRVSRLAGATTAESVYHMFLWSKEFIDVQLVPDQNPYGENFCAAIVRFRTRAAAVEAKNKLDGRPNFAKTAEMVVELLPTSPVGTVNYTFGRISPPSPGATASPTTTSNSNSSNPSSGSRPMGGKNQHGFANNMNTEIFPGHVDPDFFSTNNPFVPPSQMGNHLHDRTRVSGKSLIENNSTDEETSDLLRNPIAYAENGGPSVSSVNGRRATEPQIPVGQFDRLSLNTSGIPSSSAPVPSPYGNPMSAHANGTTPFNGTGQGYPPPSNRYYRSSHFPPINPADQNPPCNTLYVGNLPLETNEEELKTLFSKQRGYKRLCFRAKHNGPMCFVEFEDISFATKALNELYGHPLHNSTKGGIRLSFSKNPLGVRSQHNPGSSSSSGATGGMNGSMSSAANGFTTASGPPPGLSMPPGLAPNHVNYNAAATNSNHIFGQNGFPPNGNHTYTQNGFSTNGHVPNQNGFPPNGNQSSNQNGFPPNGNHTPNQNGFPSNGSHSSSQNGFPPNGNHTTNQNGFPPNGSHSSSQNGYAPNGNHTTNQNGFPPNGPQNAFGNRTFGWNPSGYHKFGASKG